MLYTMYAFLQYRNTPNYEIEKVAMYLGFSDAGTPCPLLLHVLISFYKHFLVKYRLIILTIVIPLLFASLPYLPVFKGAPLVSSSKTTIRICPGFEIRNGLFEN